MKKEQFRKKEKKLVKQMDPAREARINAYAQGKSAPGIAEREAASAKRLSEKLATARTTSAVPHPKTVPAQPVHTATGRQSLKLAGKKAAAISIAKVASKVVPVLGIAVAGGGAIYGAMQARKAGTNMVIGAAKGAIDLPTAARAAPAPKAAPQAGGLVKGPVQVRKNGKSFTQMRMIRPENK